MGSAKVAYTQSHYNLGQSCILEEHFPKHRPTTPPPPGEAVVLCLKERLIPWVSVGSNVELGGKGSSLRKVADLEIVLLCEVANANEKKKTISSCSVRDCSYSNT